MHVCVHELPYGNRNCAKGERIEWDKKGEFTIYYYIKFVFFYLLGTIKHFT